MNRRQTGDLNHNIDKASMAESMSTSFETAVTDANFAMCFYRMPFQNNIGNVTQHPSKTRPRESA
jgi:hypothetical protein